MDARLHGRGTERRYGPGAYHVIIITNNLRESGTQMPLQERPRLRTSSRPALDLPPPFRLVTLREVGDAFAHATRVAAEEGAGTRVNGGLVGGARLAWPERADENEPPAWLVFAVMIRTVALGDGEPGLRPLSAALEEEGFDDLGSGRLVESFARHLMVALDAWQEQGFGEIAKNYLARLAPESGVRRDIAENGDLLVRRVIANAGRGEAEQRSLLRALGQPSWLDPATGGPRK